MPTLTYDLNMIAPAAEWHNGRAWIECNAGSFRGADGKIYMGGALAPLNSAGSGSIELAATTENVYYRLVAEYTVPSSAFSPSGKQRFDSGWFPLTADADLAGVATIPTIPEMTPSLVERAEAAAAAAEAIGTTNDAVIAGRMADPASATRTALTDAIEQLASAKGIIAHEARRSDVKRSKGGLIGTNGRGVIAWRVDHGVDRFRTNFWPILRDRFMPCGLGVVTGAIANPAFPYEPTSMTWAQLRTMHYEGCEMWSHSYSHMDPAAWVGDDVASIPESIHREIVGSRDKMVAEGLAPVGYQTPGISGITIPDYSSDLNTVNQMGNTLTGQLVLGHYGLWENPRADSSGEYRVLPTDGCEMLSHRTIETMTLAQAKGEVDRAVEFGFGINLMFHGRFLDTPGYMNLADFTALADYVKAKWDAGEIEVLTPSGLAFADPGSSTRRNLIRKGGFEGVTKSGDGVTVGPWSLTSAAATATVESGGGHTGSNFFRFGAGVTALLQQNYYYMRSGAMQNAAFRLTAWVRNTSASLGRAYLYAGVASPGGYPEMAAARSLQYDVPAGTGWTFIQMPFCMDGRPAVEALAIRVGRHNSASLGSVDFDDIRVEPI